MTEHTDLIARLEAAETGSRELDAKIAQSIFPKLQQRAASWYIGDIRVDIEPFTTSLDAKLPDENIITVIKTDDEFYVEHAEVDVIGRITKCHTAEAHTELLARRAAAMKAMQP